MNEWLINVQSLNEAIKKLLLETHEHFQRQNEPIDIH